MSKNSRIAAVGVTALAVVWSVGATPAAAAGPEVIKRTVVETFQDDFIADLCGIVTTTTLTESLVIREWADGSAKVHVQRTYVPADPRVTIERSSRTETYAPDGTVTMTGLAIMLVDQVSGRIVVRDAGQVTFSDDGIDFRGPHPFVEAEDQRPLYCPGLTTTA